MFFMVKYKMIFIKGRKLNNIYIMFCSQCFTVSFTDNMAGTIHNKKEDPIESYHRTPYQ